MDPKIFLDPGGRVFDSGKFAGLFERDLMFVIGGAEGLPSGCAAIALGDDFAA
jgi:hypothetical protein